MVSLNVKPRGRPLRGIPESIEVDLSTATVSEVYSKIAAHTRLDQNRLRITKGSDGSVLSQKHQDGKLVTVEETGLREGSQIFVKDLGPQIAWRTVFLVEYFGPLLIHPLYLGPLRPYLYSASAWNPMSYLPAAINPTTSGVIPAPSQTQQLVCALIFLHFLKREYETIFVHRFSSATMPAFNIFKNSAHYWVLSGFNLAYWLYVPSGVMSASWWPKALDPAANQAVLYGSIALFFFSEFSNYLTHVTLRNLRPSGSTKRSIPRGYGFNLVTCPNYLFETMAWGAVTILAGGNFSAILFLAVAAGQMAVWAKKKERRYRKEFGSAYKKKSSMFPFLW
ncbi:3-oxo-5-alpha-steroid 4-dehydrogenase-domain-containing protein [Pyronema omphalodes]|nr:3-oxo-5-alpha-steroid 4-dehydrogenase-domain-containing protein [Pyronema omphalodes]